MPPNRAHVFPVFVCSFEGPRKLGHWGIARVIEVLCLCLLCAQRVIREIAKRAMLASKPEGCTSVGWQALAARRLDRQTRTARPTLLV